MNEQILTVREVRLVEASNTCAKDIATVQLPGVMNSRNQNAPMQYLPNVRICPSRIAPTTIQEMAIAPARDS